MLYLYYIDRKSLEKEVNGEDLVIRIDTKQSITLAGLKGEADSTTLGLTFNDGSFLPFADIGDVVGLSATDSVEEGHHLHGHAEAQRPCSGEHNRRRNYGDAG